MTQIAETAVVDKTAEIDRDVIVGPGCVIGPDAVVERGCELKANVFLAPGVRLGKANRIFANCVLGEEPQILNQVAAQTNLVIGDNNILRENVTINRGSSHGSGETVVGNGCYFMTGAHVGHDCEIEDEVVLCNDAQIGGHVKLERKVWMGSLCGVHQFCTVGRYAYIAGMSAVGRDIPPFVRAAGSYPCRTRGVNTIGLERAGFSAESIEALKKIYMQLFRRSNDASFAELLEELSARRDHDEHVRCLLDFMSRSSRHPLGRFREQFRTDRQKTTVETPG